MKNMKYFLIVVAIMLSGYGCGSGGSDGGSTIGAPSSIAGKFYKMTISSGSGIFATTGTYTVSFSANQNIYTVKGDGVNVADSAGTYTYFASGSNGVISIVDSLIGNGAFSLTFTSATGGIFVATAASDPNSRQAGLFTE